MHHSHTIQYSPICININLCNNTTVTTGIAIIAIINEDQKPNYSCKKLFNCQTVMFQFTTEGYVLLAALSVWGSPGLAHVPDTFPERGTTKQQLSWLHRVSQRIVSASWLGPLPEDIEAAAKAYRDPDRVTSDVDENMGYCTCGEGKPPPTDCVEVN